jgi:hypothetical protein
MRAAFTTRSVGWGQAKTDRVKEKKRELVLTQVQLSLSLAPGAAGPLEYLPALIPDVDNFETLWPDVLTVTPEELAAAEKELRRERDMEMQAMVEWIHAGAKKEDYDQFVLSDALAKQAADYPDKRYIDAREDGKVVAKVSKIMQARCARCHNAGSSGPAGLLDLDRFDTVKDYVNTVEYSGEFMNEHFFDVHEGGKIVAHVSRIMETRCARCHNPSSTGPEGQIDLTRFEVVKAYAAPNAKHGGMSLSKLAQTTHVHLLGFSLLYGLTGLIFAFTSYPGLIRLVFGPFALAAQLADISCWWLARVDPFYAKMIVVTGGCVAIGLLVQILGSLFNMYNVKGKLVLVALLIGAAGGGGALYSQVIDPYLKSEKARATVVLDATP